ncbi:MAG: AI-2E family transporter [Ruminococcaceae bacterium]|nr:AI-2E family transporter [Oscillospiraceae bacterium]
MREPKEPRIKGLINKQWWSALLWALGVILLYKLVGDLSGLLRTIGKLASILAPFIGGLVIAFLLYRPVNAVENFLKKRRAAFWRRPARAWSLVLVYLLFLGVIALAIAVIVPVLVQAVTGLISSLPTYYTTAVNFVNKHSGEGGIFESLNLREVVNGVYNFVLNHLTVANVIGYLSGIISITGSLINVLISFIISVYMLAGRESLISTVSRVAGAFLPSRAARLSAHYTRKASDIFMRYIYSMLVDAVCVCILLIPGMYISGIPYPLAFAVFVGIANIVPYFGAIISGAFSVLMLVLVGEWGMALFLAVYIIVVQQLDSNLLQPRIFGQSVGIQPIYVLLAVTVGGGLAGFLGILLGVPAMAVLKILISDLIAHRNRVRREKEEAQAMEVTEE